MHPLVLGILILVGACAAFVAWRLIATIYAGVRRTADINHRVDAVLASLRAGGPPETEQIRVLAEDPATRNTLRESLNTLNRADLFPAEFASEEASAESELVYWLRHANELGASPDEVELMARLTRPCKGGEIAYYVFRYQTHPPHWAADKGWLVGIAGPYPAAGSESLEIHPSAFSTFNPYDGSTPDEHVDWLHDMFSKRGMVPV